MNKEIEQKMNEFEYVLASQTDFNLPIKNLKNHTLLREILLVIEHTSYHTGLMPIIFRLLGLYK